jgi:hypothetical protein
MSLRPKSRRAPLNREMFALGVAAHHVLSSDPCCGPGPTGGWQVVILRRSTSCTRQPARASSTAAWASGSDAYRSPPDSTTATARRDRRLMCWVWAEPCSGSRLVAGGVRRVANSMAPSATQGAPPSCRPAIGPTFKLAHRSILHHGVCDKNVGVVRSWAVFREELGSQRRG